MIGLRGANIQRQGQFYVTYDHSWGKFLCMSLSHAFNFFFVEELSETLPRTFKESPSCVFDSFSGLQDTALDLLAWVNERRFSMPWRWTLWSQTYTNVLHHIENGNNFKWKNPYPSDETEPTEDTESEKKNMIKKIKKRLQIFEEREVAREMYRLE